MKEDSSHGLIIQIHVCRSGRRGADSMGAIAHSQKSVGAAPHELFAITYNTTPCLYCQDKIQTITLVRSHNLKKNPLPHNLR